MAESNSVLRDLKLVGTVSSNGGKFGKIRITGETTINGNLDCKTLSVVGTVAVNGSLRADVLQLTGEVKVSDEVQAGRLGGRGDMQVSGNTRFEKIDMIGQLTVRGNCESEALEMRGAVAIDGLMNAEEVMVRMIGPCRAKEIGGSSVTLKRSKTSAFISFFKPGQPATFTAGLIEGDIVSLEHTHADIVRGNHVTIGPGCVIGIVEYKDSLTVSENSSVNERIKINDQDGK